jgi:hypothetical protein
VLDCLPNNDGFWAELGKGRMVVARSENEFLYVVESKEGFHLFLHTPGMSEAGRKQFPKDEKHRAILQSAVKAADALFVVDYKEGHHLAGVMAAAEEGILAMFPGDDRNADRSIEFVVPGQT